MKIRVFVSTLIATLVAGTGLHAQSTQSWYASTNSTWDTATSNWSDDGLGDLTWQSGNAIFSSTGVGTVTIATGGVSANSLTFDTAGYTIAGDALSLTGVADIATNADVTINSVITGNVGLVKDGSGTLTLGGANTYTGNTTINGGMLNITGGIYSAYTNTSVLTVNSGATLQVSTWGSGGSGLGQLNPKAPSIVVNGGTISVYNPGYTWIDGGNNFTIGALGATLDVHAGNEWSLRANATGWLWWINGDPPPVNNLGPLVDNSSLTVTGSGSGYIEMAITGTGALTKNGSGTWILAGANTYSGATTVNGGILVLSGSSVTMGNTAVTLANVANPAGYVGNYNVALGDVWWNGSANIGTSFSVGSLSGGGALGGNVVLGQTATMTIGTDNTSTTYGGQILEYGGSAGINKVGTGTLTLTNHIYLSGTATISGGALQLGDGTTGHNGSLNSMNVVNNGSLIFDNFESQVSTNLISGTGSLTKNGAGILELNAVNTYSGATIINSGTLQLIQTNATLGSGSSAVTLANTADTLLSLDAGNWGAVNISIGSLSGGGALGGNVNLEADTLIVGTDNTSTTYGGSILSAHWGNGNLTKVGAGTLTLTGTNYYYGTTTVSGGVLELASTAQLYHWASYSTGVTVNSGGTLRLYNWGDWVDSLVQNSNDATKLTLDNGTIDMAAAGAVTGSRNFTVGAGGATLLVSNAAGNWTLNNGSGNVTNNSSLTLDGIGTGQIYMAVNGSGALIKNGAGSWSLGAANGYTGNTTVNAGTLKLAAGGSISGSTLVEIKAGATFDTTAQSFTMLGTQTFRFTINGTTGQVGKLVAGTLNITAGVVDFSTSGFLSAPAYVIASYSPGGLTGTFASVTAPSGGWIIDYNYQGLNEIALVVPEPQTWVMMLSGAGMLALFRRRRS